MYFPGLALWSFFTLNLETEAYKALLLNNFCVDFLKCRGLIPILDKTITQYSFDSIIAKLNLW